MGIMDRIEQFIQDLHRELEELAPTIQGAASLGSVKQSSGVGADILVQYPELKGTYEERQISITFSIASDFSQLMAGQPINKPTVTALDYLSPWMQIFVYQGCPFILRITPERKDLMTKFTRALGLESKGLRSGWPEFDDRFYLDCRGNREKAEDLLKTRGIRGQIERLAPFYLLRFEETYIKLVISIQEPADYQSQKVLGYIRDLSELAEVIRCAARAGEDQTQ